MFQKWKNINHERPKFVDLNYRVDKEGKGKVVETTLRKY